MRGLRLANAAELVATAVEETRKIYGTIEMWRNPPIEGEHPYV
jgi:hypothetical protein